MGRGESDCDGLWGDCPPAQVQLSTEHEEEGQAGKGGGIQRAQSLGGVGTLQRQLVSC